MAARYFVVQSSNKQVISAPAAGRGNAISATLNLRDRLQHFSLDTSDARGVYIVARSGFVLDVTGSSFAAGTALCLYGKVPAQLNQRFRYQNGTTMAVAQSPKLFVVSSGAKIVLSTASQTWALIPIPEEFKITFNNEGKEPIVVNYDNAPASENVKRWNVAPGTTVTLPFFQGSVISAKDQAGKYVDPSPYTVSKNDTITFKDNDLCKDYSGYINALTARLEALEEVVKKQQSNEAKWIRVNADKSVLKGEGLKVGKVTTADTVWTILFTTPRADASYTVVANVYHTEFWRTWPRVTNITATGFDVHFLTETKQAIAADFYKGTAGVPPLELSCIVHEL